MNKFACNNCVFALSEDKKQTGCSLGRLEKLLGRPVEETDYIETDGRSSVSYNKFCMTFRPPRWIDELGEINPSMQFMEEAVMNELKIPLGYVIDFKEDMDTLRKTLNSVVNPAYVIVLHSKPEYSQEIFEELSSRYQDIPYKSIILFVDIDFIENLDHAFKKCKNGWIMLLSAGDTVPANAYDAIYNRIYNDVRRLGVSFNEDRTKLLVQAQIFQFLGGNKPKLLGDGSIDNRGFYERLFAQDLSDKDLIVPWEELFNG